MKNNNLDIFLFVKDRSSIVVKITFIFIIFAFLKLIFSEVLYSSKITLYPAGELSDNSSMIAEYSNLFQSMGISTIDNNYYLPDIIESYSLKKEIIFKKWNNNKFESPKNLIEYWDINNSSIFYKIKNIYNGKYYNKNLAIQNTTIMKLNELITINENNSGLIEVSVLMNEPQMAADIANFIAQYVVDFIKNQQINFANKSKKFIIERKNIAHDELNNSEESLTNFRKRNPLALDTPELQLERARLIRNVKVNQEVYITLRKQLEIAKIETSKERLLINVLDKAEPTHKKTKPKILLILIIFTIFGFLFGVLSQLIILNYKKLISKY